MKKILFGLIAMATLMMSCNGATKATDAEADTLATDTVVVDTVDTVDTAVCDTVLVDTINID